MKVGKITLVRVVDFADIFVGGIPANVGIYKAGSRLMLLRRLGLEFGGLVRKDEVLKRLAELEPNLNEISSSIELDRDLLDDCDFIDCNLPTVTVGKP